VVFSLVYEIFEQVGTVFAGSLAFSRLLETRRRM